MKSSSASKVLDEQNATDQQKEIERCDREIARIENEARSGNTDIHGIVRGLTDWRVEKKMIQDSAVQPEEPKTDAVGMRGEIP